VLVVLHVRDARCGEGDDRQREVTELDRTTPGQAACEQRDSDGRGHHLVGVAADSLHGESERHDAGKDGDRSGVEGTGPDPADEHGRP
jgi:hypothetical protein